MCETLQTGSGGPAANIFCHDPFVALNKQGGCIQKKSKNWNIPFKYAEFHILAIIQYYPVFPMKNCHVFPIFLRHTQVFVQAVRFQLPQSAANGILPPG
jgi:hypothetical protein